MERWKCQSSTFWIRNITISPTNFSPPIQGIEPQNDDEVKDELYDKRLSTQIISAAIQERMEERPLPCASKISKRFTPETIPVPGKLI